MQITPYQHEYKKKCISAQAAAEKIASHSTLFVAMAVGAPPALLKAISQRIEEAEFISDHEYSGSGGQYDFVKGASLSKGGKSIIALHSTAMHGKKSTIAPKVEMVTDTRMDVEYVVTEYGVANLRGKSTKERALALIEIAHPDFQSELLAIAEKLVLI